MIGGVEGMKQMKKLLVIDLFLQDTTVTFLKDKIGAGGGTVQLNIQDIPECMHFQEVGKVDIVV